MSITIEQRYCDRYCRKCKQELIPYENWGIGSMRHANYICKSCLRESSRKNHYKLHGGKPMSQNKQCTSFLGCHVAEQVLSKAFKDVEIMPPSNPGYDFICNKGKKIDVKSSCIQSANGRHGDKLQFSIKKNVVADYFLCIAFNNRDNLNPEYTWLIPGNKINHLTNFSVAISNTYYLDEYKIDISRISKCCDVLRGNKI
jgi:hypothetical protein